MLVLPCEVLRREMPAVEHRDPAADVPDRDREVHGVVRRLGVSGAAADDEQLPVDERHLLRRILEPRRHEQRPEPCQERCLRGPRRGDDEELSPFGASPLGSLLEHMMSGSGWSRSYTYDPATGRWIDVSH